MDAGDEDDEDDDDEDEDDEKRGDDDDDEDDDSVTKSGHTKATWYRVAYAWLLRVLP